MANAKVFEDLKTALMSATPSQLNSHSSLKAAEELLACLRRDGVASGGSYAPVGASGAPSLHYGMSYVDGGAAQHGGGSSNTLGYNDGGAKAHYAALAAKKSGGAAQPQVTAEKGRGTESFMKGSSWSTNY